jgi:hypothetical protein
MLATGCSTVPMVQLRIDSPWAHSIQADGFSAPDGAEDSNLYDLLRVDLQKTLPFIFVFQMAIAQVPRTSLHPGATRTNSQS